MRKQPIKTFVAIDFETMTAEPTSVCAVGIVFVKNGYVETQYYTLVKPVFDIRKQLNTFVHGITPEMVEDGADFRTIYSMLCHLTKDGAPLVCHNRGADIRYINALEEHYDMYELNTDNNICTYELTGMNLKDACKQYNVEQYNHHDALADAQACAKLFLAMQDAKAEQKQYKKPGDEFANRRVTHDTLSIPTEDEIVNKETVFYRSNCVITGTFDSFEQREELAKTLRSLGADINTAISGKTTLVVMGYGAGPKKIEQIEQRRAKGQDIRVMDEDDMLEILESVGL